MSSLPVASALNLCSSPHTNRYVKLAFHGFEPLDREQRVQTYNDAGEWRLLLLF